jgi:glyoxylase-like metal-dependent hydrolase (beta-lactamase superfamily II)
MRHLLALLLLAAATSAAADVLTVQHVGGPAYAIIGPTSGRTYDNYGLNANFGFVVTKDGVVLIDSGASDAGARLIEQAVATVTDQAITHVLNTGSQDHRWLGNGYFAAKGARIVALQRTVTTQQQFGAQHLQQLAPELKERVAGTKAVSAAAPVAADATTLTIGGVELQLRWLGDAHFAGDAVVWLPQESVLYSGDLVYVDRLLGVLPWSDLVAWRDTFHQLEQLQPRHIVPGHGSVCDLAQAQRETGAYLDWLAQEVGAAAENWEPIDEVVERLSDAPAFRGLANFDELHRGNVNRSYVQFENRR